MRRYNQMKSCTRLLRTKKKKEELIKDSKEGTEKYAKDVAGSFVNVHATSAKAF